MLGLFLLACNEADTAGEVVRERVEVLPVGHLEGEITVMIPYNPYDFMWNIYALVFNRVHPDVLVNIVPFDVPTDISQLMAFTTRLLADPPDILVFEPRSMVFEKMSLATLFVDFNDLFYGPRGINQDDYFANIFKASEAQGGLFHLPLYVDFEFTFLNKRLFEGIGVDVSQIVTLTIDEEIDFALRINEAFPDESISAHWLFNIYYALLHEPLYNIETGGVYVDTLEMRMRIERAMEVPICERSVVFTPEGVTTTGWIHFDMTNVAFTPSRYMRYSSTEGLLNSVQLIFLHDHPDTQFSQPVFMSFGDGLDGQFQARVAAALMRNAPNQDLAWELLRFVMEYEETLVWPEMRGPEGLPFWPYSYNPLHFPINRARFEDQVGAVVGFNYLALIYAGAVDQQHREQSVADAMYFLREAMERLSHEVRFNEAVMNSLVYPDIWLLHTGRQDVARTLANIQNRLELYVAE